MFSIKYVIHDEIIVLLFFLINFVLLYTFMETIIILQAKQIWITLNFTINNLFLVIYFHLYDCSYITELINIYYLVLNILNLCNS